MKFSSELKVVGCVSRAGESKDSGTQTGILWIRSNTNPVIERGKPIGSIDASRSALSTSLDLPGLAGLGCGFGLRAVLLGDEVWSVF